MFHVKPLDVGRFTWAQLNAMVDILIQRAKAAESG
jgi:hypothetical protein